MQLSLQDFECAEQVPGWLPPDKWDDIMAVSVLPGPLDSLCVHMAKNSDAWCKWYQHEQPDQLPLPLAHGPGQQQPAACCVFIILACCAYCSHNSIVLM